MNIAKPDYGYIDHVVRTIRISAGVLEQETLPIEPGPLVSIHLQSNRPDNFPVFMENLVASLDDPSRIEVVLKIDNTDAPMNKLLPELVEKYKNIITLKFISTPLVGGFFELWRSMNDMLAVCHPHAYFLWNMNDEMAVLNKGWDTALQKYVGLFPDHLFRLRTSVFRSRNYYDYWECGFAPETSAITTKRWIDICGDWNPCLGPDSFNQCVAYYFGYHDRFYKHRVDRDIPVHDFVFAGEGAFIGMSGEALYRRARGASKAWYRLMSHKIQTEASRRSQRLMAHIWAQREFAECTIIENEAAQRMEVHGIERHKRKEQEGKDNDVYFFPYKLSKIRVKLTNFYRATAYYYYAGGGQQGTPYTRIRQIIGFLSLRYDTCSWFRTQWMRYRAARSVATKAGTKAVFAIGWLPVSWSLLEAWRKNALRPTHLVGSVGKRIFRMITTKGFNRGIRFHSSVNDFDGTNKVLRWDIIQSAFNAAKWPDIFSMPRIRQSLSKCLLLRHWYGLSDKQLEFLLGRDLAVQHFIGVPLNQPLPSLGLINDFASYLKEQGLDRLLFTQADTREVRELLPEVAIVNKTFAQEKTSSFGQVYG